MAYYVVKLVLSAAIIVAVSELSKTSRTAGAVLASLPLLSLLAMVWLYVDTRQAEAVARLSTDIFWLVLPSLPLFLILPALLRSGWSFWGSLGTTCVITALLYGAELWMLRRFGMEA